MAAVAVCFVVGVLVLGVLYLWLNAKDRGPGK
jgi:hypothetical protein